MLSFSEKQQSATKEKNMKLDRASRFKVSGKESVDDKASMVGKEFMLLERAGGLATF